MFLKHLLYNCGAETKYQNIFKKEKKKSHKILDISLVLHITVSLGTQKNLNMKL